MQRREGTPPPPPLKTSACKFLSVWWGEFPSSSRTLAFIWHLSVSFLAQWKCMIFWIFRLKRNFSFISTINLPGLSLFFTLLPAIISNSMSRASCSSNCWSTSIPSLTLSLSNASFSCCLRMSISLRSALSPSWAVRMIDYLKYEKMLMKMHKVNNN